MRFFSLKISCVVLLMMGFGASVFAAGVTCNLEAPQLVESHRFPGITNSEVGGLGWQQIGDRTFLAVIFESGVPAGEGFLRLYEVDFDFCSPQLVELSQVSLAVLPTSSRSTLDWHEVVDVYGQTHYYLAAAGDFGLRMFEYGDTYGPSLELRDSVSSLTGTVFSIAWLDLNGITYLSLGGPMTSGASEVLRVATVNRETGVVTEVATVPTSVVDGPSFSMRGADWQVINGVAYLAVGGVHSGAGGTESLRLYELDFTYGQDNPQLIEVDKRPNSEIAGLPASDLVNTVDWQEIDGTYYLAAAGRLTDNGTGGGDEDLRLYKFDDTYGPALVEVYKAPEITTAGLVRVVNWFLVDGVYYLAAGGGLETVGSDRDALRLYRFDDTYAPRLIELYIVPTTTLENDAEDVDWQVINGQVFLAAGGDFDIDSMGMSGDEDLRLFRLNCGEFGIYNCIEVGDVVINKMVDNATPNEGDTVTFTVAIRNNGPFIVRSVTVQDSVPSGLTFVSATPSKGSYNSGTGVWDVGDLSLNEAATLTLTVMVDVGQLGNTIVNTAMVMDAYNLDPYPENNTASASVMVGAGLTLIKTVDNASPREGEMVVFFVQVKTGSIARGNISVQDVLPSSLTYVSDVVSQGSYNSGSGVWTVGDIGPNSTALLAINATVNAGTAGMTIINDASIVDAYTLSCYGSDGCFDSATINVQSPCTFNNLCVNDQLPVGLDFVYANATMGSFDAGSGTWLIGDLSVGQDATLTVVSQVLTSAQGQTLTNCATIKDPYNLDVYSFNNMACVDVQVRALEADLTVNKTTTNLTPEAGTNVTFQVVVTNNGPDSVSDAFVTDMLPSQVTFVSSFATQGLYDNGSGIWSIGDIASGQSETLFITVNVNGSESAGTLIINTATVGDPYINDPYAFNNSDTVTMTVAQTPLCDLSISKTVDNSMSMAGDNVTFTVTIQNNQVN